MSTRQEGGPKEPIGSRDDLVRYLEAGCKPAERWRIGTEHEKFGFHLEDCSPVPYEGPRGIRALLEGLCGRSGWLPVMEGPNVIALRGPEGSGLGTVSLEPGGQLELSGAPLQDVHATVAEMTRHISEANAIGGELGIGFLGLGFSPKWTRAETPSMPKGRYGIMTAYMPKVGKLGLDMMYRSCTVQVNLDFASEADMVKKLRVSLALQPIASAIFANSPLTEGRQNGFLSYRSEVWRDTDPHRTGLLPFAFEPGMGFERYVDYALDVPMYFVFRNGRYIDVAGKSFRDFMHGKLAALPGELPNIDDWADHLSTLFPDVRVKRFMEMRGADAGLIDRVAQVPAFWVGLLYDEPTLEAAWELVKDWTAEERQGLRDRVPRAALATPFRKTTLRDIARKALDLAKGGLQRRAKLSGQGQSEAKYLQSVEAIVDRGCTQAEDLLADFTGRWNGDVREVFKARRY
jgi:glutamate--cysteine ligase